MSSIMQEETGSQICSVTNRQLRRKTTAGLSGQFRQIDASVAENSKEN
jgi:hypothetical protein